MKGKNKGPKAKREAAVDNLKKALDQLTESLQSPITENRDLAGIIKSFEIVFELSWRCLQKCAEYEGLDAGSPRQALQAGLSLGLIDAADEATWLQIKDDRNDTVHTYNAAFAEEMVTRIKSRYESAFRRLYAAVYAYVVVA